MSQSQRTKIPLKKEPTNSSRSSTEKKKGRFSKSETRLIAVKFQYYEGDFDRLIDDEESETEDEDSLRQMLVPLPSNSSRNLNNIEDIQIIQNKESQRKSVRKEAIQKKTKQELVKIENVRNEEQRKEEIQDKICSVLENLASSTSCNPLESRVKELEKSIVSLQFKLEFFEKRLEHNKPSRDDNFRSMDEKMDRFLGSLEKQIGSLTANLVAYKSPKKRKAKSRSPNKQAPSPKKQATVSE